MSAPADSLYLLDKAKRLTALQREESYAWISPEELLILRPTEAPFCLYPFERARSQKIPCTAHRFHLPTGQETPLSAFNEQHSAELPARIIIETTYKQEVADTVIRYDAHVAAISPDGRYLLWPTSGGLRAAALDGTETIHSGYPFYIAPIWLPDSRSWLELTLWGFRRRRLEQLNRAEHTIVSGWKAGLPVGITAANSLLMFLQFVIIDRGKLKESVEDVHAADSERFLEVKLGGPIRLSRQFEMSLPVPGVIQNVLVSPDGRRLAWLIRESIDVAKPGTYSVWTTDLAGKDIHKIGWLINGWLPDKEDEPEPLNLQPRDLQWAPEGSRISFAYGTDLYAVPVPGREE